MLILILILAAGLILWLERFIYKRYWNRGLQIQVSFEGKASFEGEKGVLLEVLENRNFLPLPFVHAKFEIGSGLSFDNRENVSTSDRHYKNDIFSILSYQRITRRLSFTCRNRGYYSVNSADLVSTDLLYGLKMVSPFPQKAFFYVYPGRADLRNFEQPLLKMIGEVNSRQFLYPDPFEFRGIRDYTLQDPMNTINWKASARTGALMVNQFDSTTSKRIVVLLNVQDETVVAHARLHEEAIRIACTLCLRLLSEGYPVDLSCNGRDLLTRETIKRIRALGNAQAEDICRVLARIDLNLKEENFAPMILREREDPDFNRAGFVLISSNQEEELQREFRLLSQEAAALWVVPLHKNMDFHADGCPAAQVIRWEVEGYA